MSGLRIRLYNVLFGDAVLITTRLPGKKRQHILIDVGNVSSGAGGKDEVFTPIFKDIVRETGGEVDLYVMTHEHLDHVQGLMYAARKLKMPVTARNVWITASAEPGYYAKFPDARKKKKAMDAAYADAVDIMARRSARFAAFSGMMANNDPRSTEQCVAHIRDNVGKAGSVHYVYQGMNVAKAHDINGATFEILAPERDTSAYYERSRPFAIGDVGDSVGAKGKGAVLLPPAGVDAGAFADLLRSREEGFLNSLLQIDRAANNTSVVFRMTIGGRVLLFVGDAETKSWRMMDRQKLLGPVDFLKLGHDGSHNGMPQDLIAKLLPERKKARHVGLSTCTGCYNNVPHETLLSELGARAKVHDTRKASAGGYIDIEL